MYKTNFVVSIYLCSFSAYNIVMFIIQLLFHSASVARHIYLRPGAGVGAMQKIYGGELV